VQQQPLLLMGDGAMVAAGGVAAPAVVPDRQPCEERRPGRRAARPAPGGARRGFARGAAAPGQRVIPARARPAQRAGAAVRGAARPVGGGGVRVLSR